MKILVVTNSCSKEMYKKVCENRIKTIVEPQQKFFRLIIDGLASVKNVDVDVMAALPVSASTVKRYIFRAEEEKTISGVCYHYIPFLNGKISRYFSLMFSAKIFSKKWCERKSNKDALIIVDPLVPMIAIPVRKMANKYGIKVVAIVTDLPKLSTKMKGRKEGWIKKTFLSLYQKIADKDLYLYDEYITLTESINEVVNRQKKPYIVIEGVADSKDTKISKVHENYIMYAGGIYEKYGVKTLVEAFIRLNRKDVSLYIFGDGPYVNELKKKQKKHSNIKYMGCVTSDIVVEYEKRALLLVNPRPINEEFAKYSFPSKTMEYMLSGTAVVSTRLLGIPDEYFNYIFAFDGDDIESVQKTLSDILAYPKNKLKEKGELAHKFVLEEKNNIRMAEKIVNFMNR
ncbi:glycosyltransferase [Clostridium perfringens]|uniref:glycosyltransferase n=1 Tax=Clostridium perfringens TaxID=1502 RepID=UPI0022E9148D|nr:glycosyltransferase [Clostridium perfringens]